MLSYQQQKQLAYLVAAVAILLGLVQLGSADLLGLSPRMTAWLGIIGSFLAAISGWLPSIRGMSTDPTFLEHRISELPEKKRRALATKLANRAAKDAEARQV